MQNQSFDAPTVQGLILSVRARLWKSKHSIAYICWMPPVRESAPRHLSTIVVQMRCLSEHKCSWLTRDQQNHALRLTAGQQRIIHVPGPRCACSAGCAASSTSLPAVGLSPVEAEGMSPVDRSSAVAEYGDPLMAASPEGPSLATASDSVFCNNCTAAEPQEFKQKQVRKDPPRGSTLHPAGYACP